MGIASRLADAIIARAQRTPYTHIQSADGTEVYMGRWWLLNPYGRDADGRTLPARWPLPSIRVHHICRADLDRHLHDHPWNARTIILRGWYREVRADGQIITRRPGDTARLRFGEFHRIIEVAPEGCWTLFITGRYRGEWGFKIPHREYLATREESQKMDGQIITLQALEEHARAAANGGPDACPYPEGSAAAAVWHQTVEQLRAQVSA